MCFNDDTPLGSCTEQRIHHQSCRTHQHLPFLPDTSEARPPEQGQEDDARKPRLDLLTLEPGLSRWQRQLQWQSAVKRGMLEQVFSQCKATRHEPSSAGVV